jgi:hypothetical protein
MQLRQLSLFLENRPGALRAPCEALAAAGINVLTGTLADTAQFGVLRLIVADPEQAQEVLEGAGMVAGVTEVLAVEVEHKPGGLAAVLRAIEEAGLGVEYMYDCGMAAKPGKATIVFRFDDPNAAAKALAAAGVRVLSREEVLGR